MTLSLAKPGTQLSEFGHGCRIVRFSMKKELLKFPVPRPFACVIHVLRGGASYSNSNVK